MRKMHAGVVLGLAALGSVATGIACSSSGSTSHDGGASDSSSSEAAGGSSGSGSGGSSSSGGASSSGTASSSGGGSSSGSASSSGGTSSSGAASSSGGTSSSGAASSSGGTSSSGGDGGSSGGTTSAYTGGLGAQIVPGGGTSIYEISGGFFATPDAGAAGACAGTTSGKCCFAPIADAGTSGGPPTYVSAGTITVKNAATTIATLDPASNDTYSDSSATDKSVTWKPGDTLAVSAAGDTVHAFAGNLVTVVGIAGLNPALSSTGTAVTISRSANFTLSWTPGPGPTDAMYFTILALVTSGSAGGSITCRGVDSDAQFVVDKSLLASLAVGDAAILSLQRTSSNTVVNDDTTLVLTSDTAVSGNGKIAK